MSWTKTKVGMWGDIPQKDGYKYEDAYPPRIKRVYWNTAKASKPLRKKVNFLYQEEFNRNATNKEFNNLLRVGLHLKGGTT